MCNLNQVSKRNHSSYQRLYIALIHSWSNSDIVWHGILRSRLWANHVLHHSPSKNNVCTHNHHPFIPYVNCFLNHFKPSFFNHILWRVKVRWLFNHLYSTTLCNLLLILEGIGGLVVKVKKCCRVFFEYIILIELCYIVVVIPALAIVRNFL